MSTPRFPLFNTIALAPLLLCGGLALGTGLQLEGHSELRAAALEQLESAAKVDVGELLITSAGPEHVIAGAPPAVNTGEDGVLGHVLLQGQGPWRGGESLPDGVYVVRRGKGARLIELVDEQLRVVASFTLDFPTGAMAGAASWSRIYLALNRELIPRAL